MARLISSHYQHQPFQRLNWNMTMTAVSCELSSLDLHSLFRHSDSLPTTARSKLLSSISCQSSSQISPKMILSGESDIRGAGCFPVHPDYATCTKGQRSICLVSGGTAPLGVIRWNSLMSCRIVECGISLGSPVRSELRRFYSVLP
jgi:hypothetical protein